MPDVPLILLTAWYAVAGRSESGAGQPLFGAEYDALFFGDPVWIVGHNLMHAPILILMALTLGWTLGKSSGGRAWRVLFWFAVGCGIHSAIDIVTHHHDGPLLLFPFNLNLRFASPSSYWDVRYHGQAVMLLEHGLDMVAVIAMLRTRAVRWARRLRLSLPSRQTD